MGTPALKFRYLISLTLFLAALAVFCSADTQELSILKGKKATNGQFPFIALVTSSVKYMEKNVSRQCGGAIYNEEWIITSSVCTSFASNNPELVQVYVGDVKTSSMQRMEVKKVYLNSNFTAKNYQYDIALLQLKKKLNFNSKVRALTLSTSPASAGTYYTAGWGVNKVTNTARSSDLYYIPQVFADPKKCVDLFKNKKPIKSFSEETLFCTKGGKKNVCAGDSGAPVFQTKNVDKAKDAVLYGLVSYGNGCTSDFNANIRIDAFACWIGKTIDGSSDYCQSAAGPSGPSGPSGPAGPAGPAGPSAPSGPAGPSAPSGPAGPTGPTGPSGPSGPAGPTGPSGPAGPTGPTGPSGPAGPAGPTGPSGPIAPSFV